MLNLNTATSPVIKGCAQLCNHEISVLYFYFISLKDLFGFQLHCTVQITLKVEKVVKLFNLIYLFYITKNCHLGRLVISTVHKHLVQSHGTGGGALSYSYLLCLVSFQLNRTQTTSQVQQHALFLFQCRGRLTETQ